MKYLISACLMGENCKYNGGNNVNTRLMKYMQGKDYVLVCPEVLGGLPTPRACAEIVGDKVMNTLHEDVSEAFHQGASKALHLAQEEHIDVAILQSRSPSCGKGKRYSGNFDTTLVQGNGVFVDILEGHGYCVYDISEFLEKTDIK